MNEKLIRQCLANFATGVTVVTAKTDDDFFGITINSFTSVSLKPPLILFNLHVNSSKLKYFFIDSNFIINILSYEQKDFSNLFCQSHVKFPTKEYYLYNNLPILNESLSFFYCKTKKIYEGGDHRIILAYIKHCTKLSEKKALLYFRSQYNNI